MADEATTATQRINAAASPSEDGPEALEPAEITRRDAMRDRFAPLFSGAGGIDSWLGDNTPQSVFDRLEQLDGGDPLTRELLNQLLVLSHEAGLSAGFFTYYWLAAPSHSFDVRRVNGYMAEFTSGEAIVSLDHLRWGLGRFYFDALLYFGNVRSAYRRLRDMSLEELHAFYDRARHDTEALERRGPALSLHAIARDDRYLISEMACKSLGAMPGSSNLADALRDAYRRHVAKGGSTTVAVHQLLQDTPTDERQQLTFTADELLQDELSSLTELEAKVETIAQRFETARRAALMNTKLYLSMVEELDVYVATSMRSREDFREMAHFCDAVFGDKRLRQLNIRYFDPTMSAAEGHEDKGLIECLMVKSAKTLIYSAGAKESFGKDAEAAMALSQGKPVIVYCPDEGKRQFYRDVHPLARLIDFRTGVANGWMVASTPDEVTELLVRVLQNRMEYELEQSRPGNLRLKDSLTGSVVRLQTSDAFLRETFWNYYHRERLSPLV